MGLPQPSSMNPHWTPWAAQVVGMHPGAHWPEMHVCPVAQPGPHEKDPRHVSLRTPHTAPSPAFARVQARVWAAPVSPVHDVGTHAPATQSWPTAQAPPIVPHVTVPPQPSLTSPQTARPHAAAAVIAVHPSTHVPFSHCWPAAHLPQLRRPPHPLSMSPHVLPWATHVVVTHDAEGTHMDAVSAELN
jgi:hypothetical protein